MAIPEANLDDELDDEGRALVAGVAAPAVEGGSPVPDDLDVPAPDVAPVQVDAVAAPAPTAVDELIANPPVTPAPAAPVTADDVARRQGAVDVDKARAQAAIADRQAEIAREADEDNRLEQAEYLQRRQLLEKEFDQRVKAAEGAKLVDPRERLNTPKAKLSVIFGGLGAAFRSAGGGDSRNHALDELHKQWEQDTEIQKANIATLKDNAVMARTRLLDADAGRRQMRQDADARLVAKYNSALKQGEAQLKNVGVSQAEIDGDARIVKLRQARDEAKLRAAKDADAHALNQARIARLNAQAARDKAKAAKGGGGGGGGALSTFVAAANRLGATDPITPEIAELGRRAGLKPNQIAAEADRYRNSGEKAAADLRARTVHYEGGSGAAPTTKSAEEFRVFETSAQQVDKALNDLEANYKQHGFEISALSPIDALKSKAVREREGIMERIILPAKEVGRLGALAGPDKEILERITGGKVAQLLGDDVGIKNMREWLARARESGKASLGIAPGAAPPAKRAAPTEDELLTEAKKVINSPGEYSPRAVQRARDYISGRVR